MDCKRGWKPPQLSLPVQDTSLHNDETLFSPGVNTPGHRLSVLTANRVSLPKQVRKQASHDRNGDRIEMLQISLCAAVLSRSASSSSRGIT